MTTDLSPFERWMLRSNLATIEDGTPAAEQVATLRANGYERVAAAVESHITEETVAGAESRAIEPHVDNEGYEIHG